MSRTTVLERVVAMVGAIDGIHNATEDEPDALPAVFNGPLAYVWIEEIGEGAMRAATMGTTGPFFHRYNVVIKVILGIPDMKKKDAQKAALKLTDRMRAKFASDYHLQNNTGTDLVFMAQLTRATANYSDFKDTNEHPRVTYTLEITEQVAANAAAQD